ncbi:MAG: nucleoside deaminase [Eubacteriaceae bacterium]|nr:nucleoside deaminase [Eubacteriaceae bacterium]
MNLAINEAHKALERGDIPIGCIIIALNGEMYYSSNTAKGPFSHAELIALASAGSNARGSSCYITLEPCPMCTWALVTAGVSKIVFGAYDYDYGACGSAYSLLSHPRAKKVECYGGILEDECSGLIKGYFKSRRSWHGNDLP